MLGNFCLAFLYLCLNSFRIRLTTGSSSDFVSSPRNVPLLYPIRKVLIVRPTFLRISLALPGVLPDLLRDLRRCLRAELLCVLPIPFLIISLSFLRCSVSQSQCLINSPLAITWNTFTLIP